MVQRKRRQWMIAESSEKSVLERCNSYSSATANEGVGCGLQRGGQTHKPDARHSANMHHNSWSSAFTKSRSVESSLNKIGDSRSSRELQDIKPRTDQGRAKPAAWFVRISDTLPTTGDLSLRNAAALNAKPLQKTKPVRPYTAYVLSAVRLNNATAISRAQIEAAQPASCPEPTIGSCGNILNLGLLQLQTALQQSKQQNAELSQSLDEGSLNLETQQNASLEQPSQLLDRTRYGGEHAVQHQQDDACNLSSLPVLVAEEQKAGQSLCMEARQSLCMEASLCFGILPATTATASSVTEVEELPPAQNLVQVMRKRQQWQLPDDTPHVSNSHEDTRAVAADQIDVPQYHEPLQQGSTCQPLQQGSDFESAQQTGPEPVPSSCCEPLPAVAVSSSKGNVQVGVYLAKQPTTVESATEDKPHDCKWSHAHSQLTQQQAVQPSTPSSILQQATHLLRLLIPNGQQLADITNMPTTCLDSTPASDSQSADIVGTPAAVAKAGSRSRGVSGFHSMESASIQQLDILKQQAVTAQAAAAEAALEALQQVTNFQGLLDAITHLQFTCTDTDSSQFDNVTAGMAAIQATRNYIKDRQKKSQTGADALTTPNTSSSMEALVSEKGGMQSTAKSTVTPCKNPQHLADMQPVVRNLGRCPSFQNIYCNSAQLHDTASEQHALSEDRDNCQDINDLGKEFMCSKQISADKELNGLSDIRRSATWRLRTNPVYEGDNDDADLQPVPSQVDHTTCQDKVLMPHAPCVRYRLRRLSLQLDLCDWSRLIHSPRCWSDSDEEAVGVGIKNVVSKLDDEHDSGGLAVQQPGALQENASSLNEVLNSLTERLESVSDICYCTWLERRVIGAPLVADADQCQQLLILMQQGRQWLATAIQHAQAATRAVKLRPMSSPGLLSSNPSAMTPNTCGPSAVSGYTRSALSPASSVYSPQLRSATHCQPTTPHAVMLAKLSALSAQLRGAHKALVAFMQRLPTATALPI